MEVITDRDRSTTTTVSNRLYDKLRIYADHNQLCTHIHRTDRPNTVDDRIVQLPTQITPGERRFTIAEFQNLADVPPEAEWFANIKNASTKRAYQNAISDFIRFAGIARPEEFRTVTRAHVMPGARRPRAT